MLIEDLRLPCEHGYHDAHSWESLHSSLPESCFNQGGVPTRAVLIEALEGVWCDVEWDHSTGGRLQIDDVPTRYALVKIGDGS